MRVEFFGAVAGLFIAGALGHGNITSPPARLSGPGMQQACGAQAVAAVEADPTNPLEDIPTAGPNCQLDLCRGAVFADNQDRVQTFTPGQTVRFNAILPIPHEGPCNVSIVDTKTNKVVGDPLIEFASYADENLAQLPPNNTDFSVKVPQMTTGQCTQPGECVMQWFWFGTSAQQTYESCVDFVMAGAGNAGTGNAGAGVAGAGTVGAGTSGASNAGTSAAGGSFQGQGSQNPQVAQPAVGGQAAQGAAGGRVSPFGRVFRG